MWEKGELKNETYESIYEKLTESLAHNEMEWQSSRRIPYEGKKLAHYLERFLFFCPQCKEKEGLYSDGDFFECYHCQYKVKYNVFGNFEQVHHKLIFTTTEEWNKWQLEFLKTTLLYHNGERPFAMTDHVKLYIAEGENPFQLVSSGNITWKLPSEKMFFHGDEGKSFKFKIGKMDGLNIHLHHYLDFFYDEKVYRMEFYQPWTSAYKWLKTFQILSQKTILNKEAMS